MDIHVHIDRLVVDAQLLERGGAPALEVAVTQELGRLLADRGLPPGGGAMPRLDAGTVGTASKDAGAFGRQIAGAVHQGMTR
jgi:hypothetical protein